MIRDPGQEICDMLVACLMDEQQASELWSKMCLDFDQARLVADAMRFVCDEFVLQNAGLKAPE